MLDEFYQKIASTHYEYKKYPLKGIENIFRNIINELSIDYSTYGKFIPAILNILERHTTEAVPILINTFFDYYKLLINERKIKLLDLSDLDGTYGDDLLKKFETALANSF